MMPRPFHFLALSALLTVVYSDCVSESSRCATLGQEYFTGLALLQWDKDITRLNARCSTGSSYFDCVDRARKTCGITNIPNDPLPEQKKFRDRLCTADSDLQKKYLKSAQCLEGKSLDLYGACGTSAAPQHKADFVIPEEQKKMMCIYYRTIPCLQGKIEESCGKDARSVFDEVTKPELPMLKAVCDGAHGSTSSTVVYSDCVSEFSRCAELGIEYIAALYPLQWEKDITQLNSRCSTGSSYFDCMDGVRKTCNVPNIPDPLPEQKKFRDRLCTADSDLQKKYLKSAQCLEGKFLDIYGACGTSAAPQHKADFVITEEHKKMMCIYYRTIPCLQGKIEESCGKDARSVFEEVTKPELPMLKAVCDGAHGLVSFNWILAAGLLFLVSFYSM